MTEHLDLTPPLHDISACADADALTGDALQVAITDGIAWLAGWELGMNEITAENWPGFYARVVILEHVHVEPIVLAGGGRFHTITPADIRAQIGMRIPGAPVFAVGEWMELLRTLDYDLDDDAIAVYADALDAG